MEEPDKSGRQKLVALLKQIDQSEDNLPFPDVVKRFIASVGGIDKAAELMKTSSSTMCRWKDGDAQPRDPSVEKNMRELVNGSHVDPAVVAKYDNKRAKIGNHRLRPNVIAAVERGMAFSQFVSKGYKEAQINKHDYAILYKMVALRDHRGTPINDRERIIHLLNTVDQERSCSPHRVEMREIIERNWSRLMVKKDRHVVKREKERFDMTIINVGEVCSSMSEMAVPSDLSDIQRDASISTLMSSISNITDLVSRLVGEKDTSHD